MATYTVEMPEEEVQTRFTIDMDGNAPPVDQPSAEPLVMETGDGSYQFVNPADRSQPSLIGDPIKQQPEVSLLKDLGKKTLRTVVEAGGGVVGATLGAPGGPLGMGAGGALGYGISKNILDLILGENKVESWGGAAKKTATDLGVGALQEVGGRAIPAAAGMAYRGLRNVGPKFTNSQVSAAAGRGFNDLNMPPAGFENNAAEADALADVVSGLRFNPAQRTGAPSTARAWAEIQRSAPLGQNAAAAGEAGQQAALRQYLDDSITGTGTVDDLYNTLTQNMGRLESNAAGSAVAPPAGVAPYDAGEQIISAVRDKAAPIKKQMGELFDRIPTDYRVGTSNTRQAFTDLDKAGLPLGVKSELAEDVAEYKKVLGQETSVAELQGAYRHFNERASTLAKDGKDNAARIARGLRDAIDSDFAALGEKARTGAVMELDGKLINPAALGDELAANTVKIAELKSGSQAVPDMAAVRQKMQEAGERITETRPGVNQAAADKDNLAAYRRFFNEEPPNTGNDKVIANYEARNQAIREQLDRAGMARDVEADLLAARRFAKEQYYDKFKTGDVGTIQRAGNEASGLRLEYETIPTKFMNKSGAMNLKKAIGPKEAADAMRGHYEYEFGKMFERNPGNVRNWLQTNREGLKEYGLDKEFSTLAKQREIYEAALANKASYEKSIAGKILGTDDVTKAIEVAASSPTQAKQRIQDLLQVAGDNQAAKNGLRQGFKDFLMGKISNAGRTTDGANLLSDAKAQQVLKSYRPAMEQLYTKQEMAAFDNVAKAVEILRRGDIRVAGGNSSTAQNLVDRATGAATNVGGVSARLAVAATKMMGAIGREDTMQMMVEAAYNPELAAQIQKAATNGTMRKLFNDWYKRTYATVPVTAGKNAVKAFVGAEEE